VQGGIATELKDVAVRITPISRGEAGRMIRSLKTFPLLDGYRGAPPCDVASLEDVLLRVSALVEAHSDVAGMDLNPLIVSPKSHNCRRRSNPARAWSAQAAHRSALTWAEAGVRLQHVPRRLPKPMT
jgi:acyl-CoA synthetase (NDP forming)